MYLEPNLGTYIRSQVSSISLPNRHIWSCENMKSFFHDERKMFCNLVFGIAFLIAFVGTFSRFLALPSRSLRQAEDVRVCFSRLYPLISFCFVN